MRPVFTHAANADRHHALQTNLAVQLLSNGSKTGDTEVIRVLMENDVYDLFRILYLILDSLDKTIHGICNIVIHLKRCIAFFIPVLGHEQVRHNIPGVIDHEDFLRILVDCCDNLSNVIAGSHFPETLAERQRLSFRVKQYNFILCEEL